MTQHNDGLTTSRYFSATTPFLEDTFMELKERKNFHNYISRKTISLNNTSSIPDKRELWEKALDSVFGSYKTHIFLTYSEKIEVEKKVIDFFLESLQHIALGGGLSIDKSQRIISKLVKKHESEIKEYLGIYYEGRHLLERSTYVFSTSIINPDIIFNRLNYVETLDSHEEFLLDNFLMQSLQQNNDSLMWCDEFEKVEAITEILDLSSIKSYLIEDIETSFYILYNRYFPKEEKQYHTYQLEKDEAKEAALSFMYHKSRLANAS